MEPGADNTDLLDELQRRYGDRLSRILQDMADSRQRLRQGGNLPEETARLHRHAHSLAGSGATFGYPGVSAAGQELEAILTPVAESGGQPSPAQMRRIDSLLADLRMAAQAPAAVSERPPAAPPVQRQVESRELIFLIEDDPDQASLIVKELELFGYEVVRLSAATAVSRAAAHRSPTAVVLSVMMDGRRDAGFEVAEQLVASLGSETPLIFISMRNDFDARLAAIRAGAAAYLVKPFDPIRLIDCLDRITGPVEQPYRILLMEDDSELAAKYAAALESAGMRAVAIHEPRNLLDEIDDFDPELVIMDIFLPNCTGIELAKLIRQNEAYTAIPIVFLSTEARLDRQLIAMSHGGDDFLTKPVTANLLVASVTSRVKRARALRALMTRDSFTGLLNRASFVDQLELALASAGRSGGDLSVALLDIDHFKQVNDQHGHAVGDRVLKSLARLLKQRLRRTDIIGRYGGEEFAVVVTGTRVEPAARVMDEIRTAFAALTHETEAGKLSVTFSCGFADFSHNRTAGRLLEAADQALYRAKAAGRNRIEVAGDSPGAGQLTTVI